jgi:hypothetical protein
VTWPRWGMWDAMGFSALTTPEHRTAGPACSSSPALPTPQAHDAATPKTPAQIAAHKAAQPRRAGGGPPGVANLNERIREVDLLPTPESGHSPAGHGVRGGRPGNGHQSGDSSLRATMLALLPTPVAEDSHRAGRGSSPRRAARRAAQGRQLSVTEALVMPPGGGGTRRRSAGGNG